jgi:peptidylprolyl isomerase
MSKAEVAKLPPLTIPPPSGPPPKRFEIVDLREGSGPVVSGLSGGVASRRGWGLAEEASNAFLVGLPGMRVGGRRELIVPPKVAYPRWQPSWGYAPYVSVYVVDLLGVERRD